MFIKRMLNEQSPEIVQRDVHGLYPAKSERNWAMGRLMRSSILVSCLFAFIIVWSMFAKELSRNDIIANMVSVSLGISTIVMDVIRLKKADSRVWNIRGQIAKDNGSSMAE